MEIKLDIRNDLFKRNEIKAELEAEKNPGFDEVRKMISEKIKKSEDSVDVYGIKGGFGSNNFIINAYVYDSKEDKDKAEQLTQKQRKADKEGEKEEEKKQEEEKPETTTDNPKPEQATESEAKEEAPAEAPVEKKPVEPVKE